MQKTQAYDFNFFLEQKNFMKVVDTLEKFEEGAVDKTSDAGKDFLRFKRQLYKLYEVQNRSVEEHEAFSLRVDRRSLNCLYNANLRFVEEVAKAQHHEKMADYGMMGNKVLKKKYLSPRRRRGITFFGLAAMGYWNLTALSLMCGGSTIPLLGIAFCSMNFMQSFNQSYNISWIEAITEGEHAGKLRLKIGDSPYFGRTIITNTFETHTLVSCGADGMGGGVTGSNFMRVMEYTDEATGEVHYDGVFLVSQDSWRDFRYLEWVNGQKNPLSQTLIPFHDLETKRTIKKREEGAYYGLGPQYFQARTVRFANIGTDNEIDSRIENSPHIVDETLRKMADHYGKD